MNMTFWGAVIAQAAFFFSSGWLFRAWVERGRRENERGGYIVPPAEVTAAPYDWQGDFPAAPAVSDGGAA